jgi:MFS family permease
MNIIAEVQQVCALDMLKPGRQTELMLNRAHRLREAVSLAPAAGFWIVAAAFVAVMAIGALPTPLYVLYERRDHFSGLIVTVIFAAYALGVVASLFLAGHISDWFGRRRVIVPAIAIGALSAGVFGIWPALPGLLVARVLSGLSVGVVTATATAYLAELHAARGPRSSSRRAELVATAANLGGIGVGPLAAGLLAQFLPAPLVLSYIVFAILALALALAVVLAPETAGVSERPRYRTQRISVPPAGRRSFLAAAAGGSVALAVFGLFTSLAPSFLAGTLGYRSHALAGFAAFVVFAAGAVAQSLLARLDARALYSVGIVLLPAGLAVVTAATWLASLPAFLAGGVLCGAGAGVIFKGGINTVMDLAPREVRAEALATFFLASYLGLSGPILGLGVATQYVSARVSLLGFAGVLVVALGAVAPALLRGGSGRAWGRSRGRGRGAAEITYQGAGS